MNNKRRTLTVAALAVFALATLVAPWDLIGSTNHHNDTRFAPVFFRVIEKYEYNAFLNPGPNL